MENLIAMSPVAPPPPQGKKGWVAVAVIAGVLVCCLCLALVAAGVYLYIRDPGSLPGPLQPSPNVIGTWDLNFDWDCAGNGQAGIFTFRPNGTFTDGDGSPGAWILTGNEISMRYENGTTYTGTVRGSRMNGEMIAFDGATGCWDATRANP